MLAPPRVGTPSYGGILDPPLITKVQSCWHVMSAFGSRQEWVPWQQLMVFTLNICIFKNRMVQIKKNANFTCECAFQYRGLNPNLDLFVMLCDRCGCTVILILWKIMSFRTSSTSSFPKPNVKRRRWSTSSMRSDVSGRSTCAKSSSVSRRTMTNSHRFSRTSLS